MNLFHSTVAVLASAWKILVNSWQTMIGEQIYRPEAYYMRGPGPKWREKHAQTGGISSEIR